MDKIHVKFIIDRAMTNLTSIEKLSSGARFYRVDLHIHSYGASHDVKDKTMTPEAIVDSAISEGLEVISITDHNEISNVEKALVAAKGKNLLVIPGVELSTPQGHLLCYLPDLQSLQSFHGKLDIADRGTNTSHCKNSILDCLKHLKGLGGFAVLAHVDGDAGFEKVVTGGATPHKKDVICDMQLLGIEVLTSSSDVFYSDVDTNSDRVSIAKERIKRLELGESQFLARVLNSDAHALKMVGKNAKGDKKVTRVKMESPSFEALRIGFIDADARIRIEEEIPAMVPHVVGIAAQGGFLDGLVIHFSQNLNCIIGGRGTGKSTTFEGVRCLIAGAELTDTVDSEVWPDELHLFWKDQAGQIHELRRPIHGEIVNVTDPHQGPVAFDIESYSQGETTKISRAAKDDPVALLTYLDRFTDIRTFEEQEDTCRDTLLDLWTQIEDARKKVARIPDCVRDLDTKTKQLTALSDADAEQIIKLQRALEEERGFRALILEKVSAIEDNIECVDCSEETDELAAIAKPEDLSVGKIEYQKIVKKVEAFASDISTLKEKSLEKFSSFKDAVGKDLQVWKEKDEATERNIEAQKKKLSAKGVRLDMAFIKRLTEDEAKLKKELAALKKWEVHLKKLEKQYAAASKARWSAREKVAMKRVGYAKIANSTLSSVLKDLTVSLKFITSAYSPAAEDQIVSAMGWRTSKVPKAALLIEKLTIPKLIESIDKKDYKAIQSVKTNEGVAIFNAEDAKAVIDKLADPSVKFAIERSQVFDLPKLTISGKVKQGDGSIKTLVKDFSKLSLGQQQSVLLALMLSANSNAPLIIDQPEDHLDSEFIYRTLVPVLRQAKERRQVIVVTHNPNIAVLGDAEQIIVLKSTSEKGSIISQGSIDNESTADATCSVLEGAKEAFNRRAVMYRVFK